MRHPFPSALLLASILCGSQAFADLETDIARLARRHDGINIKKFPDARAELLEHVRTCGLGVVEGWPGQNRCTHTIRLDEYFLRPLKDKTGFLYDENSALKEPIQYLTVLDANREPIPDHWDLADIGPMTDIHSQKCGDCWSTSSRKLLEQALATHGTQQENGDLFLLSEQTTLSSCCTWCGSCNGGYMSTPNFFSTEGSNARGNGLPLRALDPYLGRNSSCRFTPNELQEMPHKLVSAPYVGSSLRQSRFFRPDQRSGPKVEETMTMMMRYKSNALVTISAISSSGGIITSCSNINSGGNHMQNIVGWYTKDDMVIARVQNSWGKGHGQDGYTHIRWECGAGRFNRGLGVSTRVAIYDGPDVCTTTADAYAADTASIQFGKTKGDETVVLGRPGLIKQKCQWLPSEGIVDVMSEDGCQVRVSPDMATEYHLVASETTCNTQASSMVLVTPTVDGKFQNDGKVLTPHGIAEFEGI